MANKNYLFFIFFSTKIYAFSRKSIKFALGIGFMIHDSEKTTR